MLTRGDDQDNAGQKQNVRTKLDTAAYTLIDSSGMHRVLRNIRQPPASIINTCVTVTEDPDTNQVAATLSGKTYRTQGRQPLPAEP